MIFQTGNGTVRKIDFFEHLSKNRALMLLYNLNPDLMELNNELVQFKSEKFDELNFGEFIAFLKMPRKAFKS